MKSTKKSKERSTVFQPDRSSQTSVHREQELRGNAAFLQRLNTQENGGEWVENFGASDGFSSSALAWGEESNNPFRDVIEMSEEQGPIRSPSPELLEFLEGIKEPHEMMEKQVEELALEKAEAFQRKLNRFNQWILNTCMLPDENCLNLSKKVFGDFSGCMIVTPIDKSIDPYRESIDKHSEGLNGMRNLARYVGYCTVAFTGAVTFTPLITAIGIQGVPGVIHNKVAMTKFFLDLARIVCFDFFDKEKIEPDHVLMIRQELRRRGAQLMGEWASSTGVTFESGEKEAMILAFRKNA